MRARYSLVPLDGQEAEAHARRCFYAAYDVLPTPLRAALRECPYDIHILQRLPAYMDCTALIERIRGIRSEADAIAFNQQYANFRG